MQEEITLDEAVELYPDYKFTCVWTWQHKDESGDCVEQFEREYSFINATAAELEPYLPLRPDEAEEYTAEYNRYMEMDYLPPM